jgi:ATP adenylyltransferase
VFCRLQQGADDDGLILQRGPNCFVVVNLFPYAVGHTMVIPYRHLGRLSELTTEELAELGTAAARTEGILRQTLGADRVHHGINLGRPAGAGVEGHLHLHLVPFGRRIPTEAEGTELPVPLATTSARLRGAFDETLRNPAPR